jgi:uncharacterized protein DUF3455
MSQPITEANMLARISGQRRFLPSVTGAVLVSAGLLGASSVGSGTAPASVAVRALAADSTVDDSVPPEIRVPPGNRLVAALDAQGVQVYTCTAGTWVFLEPVAQLSDASPAAIHFRGPSWESTRDGSLVEAATVASSPVAGSIPQLLLRETLTRGDGIFGSVSYVQRLDTVGGGKPSSACLNGQTKGVPYTAEYRFFTRG